MTEQADVPKCIFCRIASGDAQATVVYQDETVVAFRDLNPCAPTHVLIIPRKHVPSLNALSQEDEAAVGHIVRVAARIAGEEGIAEASGPSARGYRVVANCGPEAGQSVDHVHFHLVGGRVLGWPPG